MLLGRMKLMKPSYTCTDVPLRPTASVIGNAVYDKDAMFFHPAAWNGSSVLAPTALYLPERRFAISPPAST